MARSRKALVERAQSGALDPYVEPRHAEWLRGPRIYTPEAVRRISGVLLSKGRSRSGRFSPSALMSCNRRQVFRYNGVEEEEGVSSITSEMIMQAGTNDHLWFQLEGLSAGWIKSIEVWVHDEDHHFGGSIDAILDDGSVLEIKTLNSYRMSAVQEAGPFHNHLLQTNAYMHLVGTEYASLFYIERANGNYIEYRIQKSESMVEEVYSDLNYLNAHVAAGKLPPMLAECAEKTGTAYRQCPYRQHCLTTTEPIGWSRY